MSAESPNGRFAFGFSELGFLFRTVEIRFAQALTILVGGRQAHHQIQGFGALNRHAVRVVVTVAAMALNGFKLVLCVGPAHLLLGLFQVEAQTHEVLD